jgi:hypothetical protein
MFMAAALLLATALGGCAVYPDYSYSYGPGYYATYPGGSAYQYRPYYSPDYNGTFNTYPTSGGLKG